MCAHVFLPEADVVQSLEILKLSIGSGPNDYWLKRNDVGPGLVLGFGWTSRDTISHHNILLINPINQPRG